MHFFLSRNLQNIARFTLSTHSPGGSVHGRQWIRMNTSLWPRSLGLQMACYAQNIAQKNCPGGGKCCCKGSLVNPTDTLKWLMRFQIRVDWQRVLFLSTSFVHTLCLRLVSLPHGLSHHDANGICRQMWPTFKISSMTQLECTCLTVWGLEHSRILCKMHDVNHL